MSSPAPLAVLSYNICFEAMTNRSGGTAGALGAQCPGPRDENNKLTGLTTCGQRTAAAIDAMPSAMGVSGFDIVGLQEASHWRWLQAAATGTLAKMQAVNSKAHWTEMVTFYDGSVFTLAHPPVLGSFDYLSGDPPAKERPFQILVLRRTGTAEGVIFANCHCPHGWDHNSHGESFYDFGTVARDLGEALAAVPLTDAEKAYRLVLLGDFNETGQRGRQVVPWKPFAKAGIETTVSMDTTPFTSPPADPQNGLNTCCEGGGQWTSSSGALLSGSPGGGDFIFDSHAPAQTHIPKLPPTDFDRTSDHLPVVATL